MCCAAAVASAVETFVLFHHSVSVNRVYLGTDTRAQCLFIGSALAVGLVLLTQRSHTEGRLKEGELWTPANKNGRLLCGLAGIVGAIASVILWIVVNQNHLDVPLPRRLLPHRPGHGGNHPRHRRGPPQPGAPLLVAGPDSLRRQHLLRAVHLALAALHLGQRPIPGATGLDGLRALRGARAGDLRRVHRLVPPG